MVEQTASDLSVSRPIDAEETKIDRISLTVQEQKLFNTLMEIVRANQLNTKLRVAGGWVRDKLLGLESDDIDIALDDKFGEEFAKLINDHLNVAAAAEGGQNDAQNKQRFGVIKANNEMSKHLETATIRVEGQMIDLVNLRSETYTEDSRVPTIEFGSPSEDAYRRDLTINSMFYNINEEKIEDWTERGISDLRSNLIRTPLEPLQTFLDDPLRVLRTIRFANRFEFEIVPEIFAAAKNPQVRDFVLNKVSFERYGIELDKMFQGNRPETSAAQLHDFELLQLLYKIPPESDELQNEALVNNLINQATNLAQVLGHLFRNFKIQLGDQQRSDFSGREICTSGEQLKDLQMRCFYTALLLPFYEFQVPQGKKKALISVVQHILNVSLKRSTEVQKFVLETSSAVPTYLNFMNDFANDSSLFQVEAQKKIALGWFLRSAGPRWTSIQLLSCAQEYIKTVDGNGRVGEIDITLLNVIVSKQTAFNAEIEANGLTNIHQVKPLVDGKQICAIYEVRPGKLVKPLIDELLTFQMLQPQASKEDAEAYMVAKKAEFLARHGDQ